MQSHPIGVTVGNDGDKEGVGKEDLIPFDHDCQGKEFREVVGASRGE